MTDIICYKSDGQILDYYTQWDVGQQLMIKGVDLSSAPYFYFTNSFSDTAYVMPSEVIDEAVVVSIPDILLQHAIPLIVYISYNEDIDVGTTEYAVRIPVMPRVKPNDYVYNPESGGSGGPSVAPVSIANDLTTNDPTAALSAAQGVVLKEMISVLSDRCAQPDWNAAEGQPGHILNRTHWTEGGGSATEVLPEMTIESEEDIAKIPALGLVTGNTYTVNLSGTEYTCVAQEFTDSGITAVCVGDVYTASDGAIGTEPTGEPFALVEYPPEFAAQVGYNVMVVSLGITLPVTVSIFGGAAEKVHKLDNKYLDLDWLPVKVDGKGEEYWSLVNLAMSHNDQNGFYYTSFDGNASNGGNGSGEAGPGLVANREYIVHYEGTDYACTAKRMTSLGSDYPVIAVGNVGIYPELNYPDTGEPFAIIHIVNPDTGACVGYEIAVTDGTEAEEDEMGYLCRDFYVYDVAKVPNKIPEEFLPDDIGAVTPDWNAVEGESGHILNRPFYSYTGTTTILDGTFEPGSTELEFRLSKDENYAVFVNGVECVGEYDSGGETFLNVRNTDGEELGIYIYGYTNITSVDNLTPEDIELVVIGPGEVIEKLPTKYLDVEVIKTIFDSEYVTEEFVKNKIAEAELDGGDVDLSGYAQKSDLPTRVSQLTNDAGYLTEHQDISEKLDASKLPEAIDEALAQAKASGDFDGVGITSIVQTETSTADGGSNITTIYLSDGSTSSIIIHNGSKGSTGDTGRGINSVARTSGDGSPGTTDIYTITYSDDTTSTFSVYNGADGKDGTSSSGGGSGESGEDGATFTPHVDSSGNLSWTNDKGLDNPETVNIMGDDGVSCTHSWSGTTLTVKSASGTSSADLKGADGVDGVGITSVRQTVKSVNDDGDNVVIISLSDGTTSTITIQNGSKGNDGDTGKDGVGIVSIEQTAFSDTDDGINTYTVNLSSGTSFSFNVKNGSKGSTGDTGAQGERGEQGIKGDVGDAGYSPVKGIDYWTEADKEAIINDVLECLPAWTGGSY